MQRGKLRRALTDFKNALGISNFSKELSETEFKLISLVADAQEKNENINLTTISTELNVTRSAVTQIVNKLMSNDYLQKYTIESNKKEIYLRIGDKAIEQYNLVMSKIMYFFEKLFDEIGQEGIDNIERYIAIGKNIALELKKESECKC